MSLNSRSEYDQFESHFLMVLLLFPFSLFMFMDDRSSRTYEDILSPELFILISIPFDIYKNIFQIS